MLGRILLCLALLPVLELTTMIKVHSYWSGLWGRSDAWLLTLGLILFSAFVGTTFAKQKSFRLLRQAQEQLGRGENLSSTLLEGLLSMAGAILLIIPGYITDMCGILLLIPWTSALIARGMGRWLEKKVRQGNFAVHYASTRPQRTAPQNRSELGTVIDVEATDKTSG